MDRRDVVVGGAAASLLGMTGAQALAAAAPRKFESQREFSPSEEAPLQPGELGDYNTETFNQWAFDPVANIGLNIWFAAGKGGGGTEFPNFMSTITVYTPEGIWDGQGLGKGNHADGVAAGNAFLTRIEPFKRWKIDFLGLLRRHPAEGQTSAEAPQLARMDLVVDIVSPPIEQGSQGDRGKEASSGTTPRNAIRYEQLCHIRGTVELGGKSQQVDAMGLRSHRRNSASIYDAGAVGHTWAAGLFPSGRGFHLLSYNVEPKGEVGFLYGHYFDGTAYHEGEVLRFPYFSGNRTAENLRLEMRVDGRIIGIDVETQAPVYSQFPPQNVRLTRSAARFRMDGEAGGGVIERSLMPAYAAGGEYVAKRRG